MNNRNSGLGLIIYLGGRFFLGSWLGSFPNRSSIEKAIKDNEDLLINNLSKRFSTRINEHKIKMRTNTEGKHKRINKDSTDIS